MLGNINNINNMDYIVNKDQLNRSIEKYLNTNYPDIDDIEFDTVTLGAWTDSYGRKMKMGKRTIPKLKIIFKEDTIPYRNDSRMHLKYGIQEEIKNLFGFEGNNIILEFYYIKTTVENF